MNRIGKPVVTQQMVADAAKVHTATVSLALRNSPKLPDSTCLRIQALARRMGYSPNPLVSILMARVRRRKADYRGTLAYLHTVPKDSPQLFWDVRRNYLLGARRRAAELGYVVDEFFLEAEPAAGSALLRVLRARGVAGIVIEHSSASSCPNRRLPFDTATFAAVSLGVPLAEPQLHFVSNDQYMRAILAARELLVLGYRRLGLVLSDNKFDTQMVHRCSAGFWAVQEYVADLAVLPICRLAEKSQADFGRWLRRNRPDVVLATGEKVLALIRDTGLRVPEDVGCVCLDWQPRCKPIAGVYGNSEHTGAAAVELVVSQLHRGEAGPPQRAMNFLVPGSWMPGNTIRRVGPAINFDASFFGELYGAVLN